MKTILTFKLTQLRTFALNLFCVDPTSRNRFRRLLVLCLPFLILTLALSGCYPSTKLTVASAGLLLEDIARAAGKQSDLRVIQEAMPAYLLLMDGMVEAWPDNDRVLLGAAKGYSSYASVLGDENEPEYTRVLYTRATRYALRALEIRGFKNPRHRPFEDFQNALARMGKKDVPYLFWAGTCWAGWISVNLDSMEALAELPRVELIMQRLLELDEGFYYGGPHLFMGIYHASRPKIAGGDLQRARRHFLQAIALSDGRFLMAYVYYAQYYARKKFDRELFISTLQKVLDTQADTVPELTLLNTVAHQRARQMLANTDQYF